MGRSDRYRPDSKVRGEDVAHFMVKFEVACHVGAVLVMLAARLGGCQQFRQPDEVVGGSGEREGPSDAILPTVSGFSHGAAGFAHPNTSSIRLRIFWERP